MFHVKPAGWFSGRCRPRNDGPEPLAEPGDIVMVGWASSRYASGPPTRATRSERLVRRWRLRRQGLPHETSHRQLRRRAIQQGLVEVEVDLEPLAVV